MIIQKKLDYVINEIRISNIIKLFLVIISLYSYKKVYEFRIDQEFVLYIFVLIAFTLFIVKIFILEIRYLSFDQSDYIIGIFILIMTISLAKSTSLMISFHDYFLFILYFIYFYIFKNSISKEQLPSFIHLLTGIAFVISIYAIIQYYGWDFYFTHLKQISSTIGQKNWISNYLGMLFPIAFSFFVIAKSKRNKIIHYIVLSVLFISIMICQSRGIWISIFFATIFVIYFLIKMKLFYFLKDNKKWLIILLITFLIIMVIYSTDNPLNRGAMTFTERAISTFDEKDPSINSRILIYRTALKMIIENPLIGVGIGGFKAEYMTQQAEFIVENPYFAQYSYRFTEAHNEYLQIGAETGLTGLIIFILFLIYIYKIMFSYLRFTNLKENKFIILFMMMSITIFLIHSLFTFPLHVPVLGIIFFTMISLVIIFIKEGSNQIVISRVINLNKMNLDNKKRYLFIFLSIIIMFFSINRFALRPYIAELFYYKGMESNIYEQNYEKGLLNFQKAAELDKHNSRILHELGFTYYILNKLGEAEEYLLKSRNILTEATSFFNLGLIYSEWGNLKETENEFKMALYLNPKYTKALNHLYWLYYTKGEYVKAIDVCERFIDYLPKYSEKYVVLYYIGMAYQRMENQEEAYNYFLEALKEAPDDSPIMADIEQELLNIFQSMDTPSS